MPKDYAKIQHKEHKPIPGWVWMTAGLVIGLFVALLVYISDNSSSKNSLSEKVSKAFTSKTNDARSVKKQKSEPDSLGKTLNKLKFDFYTILPELEVAIPEQDLLDSFKNTKADKTSHKYILQAGSFKKFEDADRLKATLALQGIEANIQKVKINDTDTWHRVRIGPLTTNKSLNNARLRLRDLGIASIVLKDKN
jgi:cell division protein FtsN